MKEKLAVPGIIAVVALTLSVSGQSFVNLDFENAQVVPNSLSEGHLDWNLAVPGWSHSDGWSTSIVYWRSPHLGSSQYFLLMDATSPFYATNTHLAGRYSLALASGTGSPENNFAWVNAYISQTGMIPAGTRSLSLLANGPFELFVGGAQVPVHALGESGYWGDISSYAGTIAEVRIVNTETVPHRPTVVDNIRFSSNAVPVGPWIDYRGGVYSQDFNTLESGLTDHRYAGLPAGWSLSTGYYVWAPTTDDLDPIHAGYCISPNATDLDKSIALSDAGNYPAYLGVRFRNTTGTTLTSFTLSYVTEEWAFGVVPPEYEIVPVHISLSTTDLPVGQFDGVPSLGMHSIHYEDGSVFLPADGNAPSNRRIVTATVPGITWLPDRSLWIRWTGLPGNYWAGHILAIDDLTFSAGTQLQISATPQGHLRLAWSTNEVGFSLQAAETLTPAEWVDLPIAPSVAASQWAVEIEATGAQRFFRLAKE